MKRAWFSGALAVFGAHAALFALIVGESRVDGLMPAIVVLMLIVMNVAGLGAYLVARRAPAGRLPLALSMAPLTAAFGTASNLLLGMFGVRADLSGFYNDAGLFLMQLGYGLFVSLVGALFGLWIAKRRAAEVAPVTALPDVADPAHQMSAFAADIKTEELPQIRSD
jgi:hypothetical protein